MPETKSELTEKTATGCTVIVFAFLAIVVGSVHFFYNFTDYGFIVPGHSEFFWGCVAVAVGLGGYAWYIIGEGEKLKEKIESDTKREDIEENVKDKLKDF